MAAYLVMVSAIFVTINFLVDLLYAAIDPRLRLDRAQVARRADEHDEPFPGLPLGADRRGLPRLLRRQLERHDAAPFLIDMAADLDVSMPLVANLVSLTATAWASPRQLAGWLSDIVGRRPVLVGALFALALTLLAQALAGSFFWVAAWAAVGGGCAGSFTGVVFAEVSGRVTFDQDSRRSRAGPQRQGNGCTRRTPCRHVVHTRFTPLPAAPACRLMESMARAS